MPAPVKWGDSQGLSAECYRRHRRGEPPLRGSRASGAPARFVFRRPKRLRPPPARSDSRWQAWQSTRTLYGWKPAKAEEHHQPAAELDIIWIRDCVGVQIGKHNSQTTTYDIILSKISILLDERAISALLALISQGAEDGFFTDVRIPGLPSFPGSSAESFTRKHPDDARLIMVRRSCGVQIGNRCFQRIKITILVDGFAIRIDSLHLRSKRLAGMRRLLANPSDRAAASMIADDIVKQAVATLMAHLEKEFDRLVEKSLITGLRSLYRRAGVSMGFHNRVRLRRRFDTRAIRIAHLCHLLTEQILRYAEHQARARRTAEERHRRPDTPRTREGPSRKRAREQHGPQARTSEHFSTGRPGDADVNGRDASGAERVPTDAAARPGERDAHTGRPGSHHDRPGEQPTEEPARNADAPSTAPRPSAHERPAASQPSAHERPAAPRRPALTTPAEQNGRGSAEPQPPSTPGPSTAPSPADRPSTPSAPLDGGPHDNLSSELGRGDQEDRRVISPSALEPFPPPELESQRVLPKRVREDVGRRSDLPAIEPRADREIDDEPSRPSPGYRDLGYGDR